MPIDFVCENCQARLRVGRRKAGARAICPRCHAAIVIPPLADEVESGGDPGESAPLAGDRPQVTAAGDGEAPPIAHPYAQFAVFDVDPELVYEMEDAPEADPSARGPAIPGRITVSRWVILVQGLLLAAVAAGSFAVGVLVGIGTGDHGGEAIEPPQPCSIRGSVQFTRDDGATAPDPGAVVIAVPGGSRPVERIELDGLRPQDPAPTEDLAGLLALRQLGGSYCRADSAGHYRLSLPDRGTYFLLYISARKSAEDDIRSKTQLAQIGRFFALGSPLFDGQAFAWREERIRGDRELDLVLR